MSSQPFNKKNNKALIS